MFHFTFDLLVTMHYLLLNRAKSTLFTVHLRCSSDLVCRHVSTFHTSQRERVSEYWREREDFPFEIRLDVPVIHCCYAVSGASIRWEQKLFSPSLNIPSVKGIVWGGEP